MLNNRNIEELIPVAIEVISKAPYCKINKIESRYFGYLNSIGPAIIQSGINQAITFFAGKDDDKKMIITTIERIMKNRKLLGDNHSLLQDLVRTGEIVKTNPAIKTRILEVIIAGKLAIQTFEKIDNKNERD